MKVINEYISISNKENGKIVELDIYGDIEDKKFWEEDVTPKMIKDELKKNDKASILEIHANSYGGNVGAGNGIIFIIDAFKKKTNCIVHGYCEGICASMASGVLMCADKIFMADNALMLVHKPLMTVEGNANDFKDAIEFLNKAEMTLLKNYRRHWKGTEEELINALEATTIYTAEEALEVGLCDEIIESVKIVASAKGIKIGNETFAGKVADMIKNKYPNIKTTKEEEKVVYDESLKEFGIDETMFNSWQDGDILMNIARTVANNVKPADAQIDSTSVEQFVDKAKVLEMLGCEDITADELLNLAKSAKNAPDITSIQNRANAYDKIVANAKQEALVSAVKAKGDAYNETTFKKMLDAFDYQEIMDMKKMWDDEAKTKLHAGQRVSVPQSDISNQKSTIKAADYDI